MQLEHLDRKLESVVNRRRVVTTGARIAYGAPLIAASFKFGTRVASAASPLCIEGTECGGTCCFCLANGVDLGCYQNEFCDVAPTCADSSTCGTNGLCVPAEDNFCGDSDGRCLYPCKADCPHTESIGFSAAEFRATVLGRPL